MLTISLSPTPALNEWQQSLVATESQLQLAAVRALNKTARWMRTKIASQTAQNLNVKVGAVRSGLVLVRAKKSRPESIVALSRAAGVIKASQLGRVSQNTRGVRAGKRQFDHAFLATMPNGHQGVFRRRGKNRLPIQEVQIVVTGKMRDVMENLSDGSAMRQFEMIFDRELRYLMRAA